VWDSAPALARLTGGEVVSKQSPQLLAVLGSRLTNLGGDAEGLLQRARERHPGDFWVNYELGIALWKGKKPEQAVGYYRAAQALRPGTGAVHNGLGNALRDQGKPDEAAAEYRKAIDLDPKYAWHHFNLGLVLKDQGKLEEAAAEYRKAIDLDPKFALPHYDLGYFLSDMGKLDDAAAEYRKAIDLDPKDAGPHNNLGGVLRDQGKPDEAAAEYRKAINLDPKDAKPHHNLGVVLYDQGKMEEAAAEYRKAIKLVPAHDPPRPHYVQQLQQCERILSLKKKLDIVLRGEAQPADAAEQVGLAELCAVQKRYAAATRFYGEAFAAQPKLADDFSSGNRYSAACTAALAGCGQGQDAGTLDSQERTRLRQRALAWLQADLAHYAQLKEKRRSDEVGVMVQHGLRHWQYDADLRGVRDAAALAKLPDAERAAWQKLWDEVAALLKRWGADSKR
jgi:Tfp pilus assembly protein PilF